MSRTSEELWADVDRYVCSMLVEHDEALGETLRVSESEELPAINVAPNQGKFLSMLARMRGARSILEIGTLAGYSTIWLARALPPDGTLVTIEVDEKHARLAEANIARAGLSRSVDLRVGPAIDVLSAMVDEGREKFDFVFIDADKPMYPRYLELVLELSRSGAAIVGDNVIRKGELPNKSSADEKVQGVRRFIEMLADDSRLDATAIQTVGTKGHDGFALAIVK